MRAISKKCIGGAAAGLLIFAIVSRSSWRVVAAAGAAESSATVGSSYLPLFKGTSLEGWHPQGEASWKFENGELVGTAKSGAGGWLTADEGYQDFVLHVSFQCEKCDAGVLVRSAKSAAGVSGIYVPLGGPQMGKLYRAKLNGADKSLGELAPMP